jgi:tetratricopeptide (TPR) repeat protein
MKIPCLLPILAACVLAAFASASEPPPEKVKELQERFARGRALLEQREFKEAREVFAGILKEAPEARGSLVLSGVASVELMEFDKAADFFERFLKLEPNDPIGLIGAIKANQALRKNVKVEALRARLLELKKAGSNNVLNTMGSYERERIPQELGHFIAATEYFAEKPLEPVFMFLLVSPEGRALRRLELVRGSDEATNRARQSHEKLADAVVYFFQEIDLATAGTGDGFKIYRQELSRPTYEQVRSWVLAAIKNPPKPLN